MSLAEWLRSAQSRLEEAGVEAPRESTLQLAEHALNLSRAAILANPEKPLQQSQLQCLEELLFRRLQHEPIAYIRGSKGFRDRILTVSPEVLIPRPETEELIDLIHSWHLEPKSILDVGTGTGCLAVCLSDLFPDAHVFGSDVSFEALRCARKNDPAQNIHWLQCDWLSCLRPSSFDLVVSNPPYLSRLEITQADPQVRDYEPGIALDGGVDGCEAYRRLIPQARTVLSPGGYLFLEGSPTVAGMVLNLLSECGFHSIQMHRDLSGKERFFIGQK